MKSNKVELVRWVIVTGMDGSVFSNLIGMHHVPPCCIAAAGLPICWSYLSCA